MKQLLLAAISSLKSYVPSSNLCLPVKISPDPPLSPLQQQLQNSTTHNVVGKTCIIASLTIGKDITVGSKIDYDTI